MHVIPANVYPAWVSGLKPVRVNPVFEMAIKSMKPLPQRDDESLAPASHKNARA
jgi:hypothetical protein